MLELVNVSARFGDRPVLTDIDLSVAEGELVSVLGPSGAGKTTLLRLIAGLEAPSGGRISWDGRDLAGVAVHERSFGLMFQDYALFPHRDVFDNVAFGLRMRGEGATAGAVRARVEEVLALVGLPGMEHRSVDRLSGGEQQRVALARAIAPSPRLLMLDEPLGSLDRGLRERLPFELRSIFRQLGLTVLYVTHDQEEALGVADRTVVLHDGRIEADAAPEALWLTPPTEFVARFLGFENICLATVAARIATTPWGVISVSAEVAPGRQRLVIHPDAFSPDPSGSIRGTVSARIFRGDHVRVRLDVPNAPPLELDARWVPLPALGDALTLTVDPAGVVSLPEAGMLPR